jgi:hypothetical protein
MISGIIQFARTRWSVKIEDSTITEVAGELDNNSRFELQQ